MPHLPYNPPLTQLVVMTSRDGCQHDEREGIILAVTDQNKDQGHLQMSF